MLDQNDLDVMILREDLSVQIGVRKFIVAKADTLEPEIIDLRDGRVSEDNIRIIQEIRREKRARSKLEGRVKVGGVI